MTATLNETPLKTVNLTFDVHESPSCGTQTLKPLNKVSEVQTAIPNLPAHPPSLWMCCNLLKQGHYQQREKHRCCGSLAPFPVWQILDAVLYWPLTRLWQTDELYPVNFCVQTHPLRHARGMSKIYCNVNIARARAVFENNYHASALGLCSWKRELEHTLS